MKATAIPVLGIWLATELFLQILQGRRPGWKTMAVLVSAAAAFVLPSLCVQAFYLTRTGSFLGNITGEMRLYDQWLPDSYFHGQFEIRDLLWTYIYQLVFPVGQSGFQTLIHGAWICVVPGLGVVAAIFWRWLPRPGRMLALTFLLSTIGLFLFFEFWPARLKPYYLPNCFPGRSWRYLDVLAPPMAAFVSVMLTLPGIFARPTLRVLRGGLLSACFCVAGYCLLVRYHQYEDSTADYRHAAAASTTSLKFFFRLPQLLDPDGCGQFKATLGWPDETTLQTHRDRFLDLRDSPPVCVWTGGARREGMNADASWSPDRLRILGGDAVLIRTFPGLRRPWRPHLLQLWFCRPTKMDSHELQGRP